MPTVKCDECDTKIPKELAFYHTWDDGKTEKFCALCATDLHLSGITGVA